MSLICFWFYILLVGSLDQVGLKGHLGDAHNHGSFEPSALGDVQQPQHLEAARQQCSSKRLRHLHVPSQYRPYEKSGELLNRKEMR